MLNVWTLFGGLKCRANDRALPNRASLHLSISIMKLAPLPSIKVLAACVLGSVEVLRGIRATDLGHSTAFSIRQVTNSISNSTKYQDNVRGLDISTAKFQRRFGEWHANRRGLCEGEIRQFLCERLD